VSEDGSSVVGMRGLYRPPPHVEGNLGCWGHEGHKKGENKPLHEPWEGNAEKHQSGNGIPDPALQPFVDPV